MESSVQEETDDEPGEKPGWRPHFVKVAGTTWRSLRHRFRSRSLEEHNERAIYAEAMFQAFAGAGAMSFVSVFLVRLGAPNWLVGLYTSLPALVMTLAILPMSTLIQRSNKLVRAAGWGRIGYRGTVALFALLPFLPPGIAPYVLVGARSLMAIPNSATNVSVQTLWSIVTTPRRRPSMLSNRMVIHRIFGALAGFAAGQWLERMPYPLNYQLLFLTAFFAGLGSVLCLSRLRVPEEKQKRMEEKEEISLREIFPLLKRVPAFRKFALAAIIFRTGMDLPRALYTIYRVRTLGSSDAWLGTLKMAQRLVGVFAFLALSRLLKKHKYRRWLWIGSAGLALFPLTTALAQTPEMLLLPALMGGTFGSGSNIFLKESLYESSPEAERPTFVAANTFISKLTRFVVPMLGTLLADLTSIRTALIVAAGVRLMGGLVFWGLGVGRSEES
ncbi:MAG: MFS transporter [Anaerolineae bacterium]